MASTWRMRSRVQVWDFGDRCDSYHGGPCSHAKELVFFHRGHDKNFFFFLRREWRKGALIWEFYLLGLHLTQIWGSCLYYYLGPRTPRKLNTKCFWEISPYHSGKESACNAGDTRDAGLIPGSGRSPEGGHGNPLQYSCLENSTGGGAWKYSPWGRKSQTQLSDWAHTHTVYYGWESLVITVHVFKLERTQKKEYEISTYK